MDKEIIEQVKEAEERASDIISKAGNDALEMVDDAERTLKATTNKSLRNIRKSELEALRRISLQDEDELETAKSELNIKIKNRTADLEQKVNDVARLVSAKVKDKWQ